MINELFIDVKERMNKAIEHFRHEVSTIRTGRASTTILDGLKVDYYGTPSPLNKHPSPQMVIASPLRESPTGNSVGNSKVRQISGQIKKR